MTNTLEKYKGPALTTNTDVDGGIGLIGKPSMLFDWRETFSATFEIVSPDEALTILVDAEDSYDYNWGGPNTGITFDLKCDVRQFRTSLGGEVVMPIPENINLSSGSKVTITVNLEKATSLSYRLAQATESATADISAPSFVQSFPLSAEQARTIEERKAILFNHQKGRLSYLRKFTIDDRNLEDEFSLLKTGEFVTESPMKVRTPSLVFDRTGSMAIEFRTY